MGWELVFIRYFLLSIFCLIRVIECRFDSLKYHSASKTEIFYLVEKRPHSLVYLWEGSHHDGMVLYPLGEFCDA